MGLVTRQLQKAIADAIVAYEGSSTQTLREMFQRNKTEAQSTKSKADEKGSH
ncbi:uncharacterized protein BXZ73DRAFT_98330 [Epithele typhae]|uniref:uncharacterized protein n=1 Tax=Epithele typhae TaxID=378194 RepID=UPI00200796F3|nr:uncharacterized protein BXZ73DRAFT_98330 [Epithele typhae]KAH9941118.1 hypothetical protein BXZ73DRAFT_98330 [Epithele typhae]